MKKISMTLEGLAPMRKNSAFHLLQNPNYFGTIKDLSIVEKYNPVVDLSGSQNFYEELDCIAYNPDTKALGAVVIVKQSSGYSGTACVGGSREYVRFFVDYNHNGTWVDEGLAQFGVYNHPFSDDLCYYAEITLSPDKANCCFNDAILPRVRAILSWNTEPTPNDPNFPFVWGDMKEADIQIAPSNSLWCHIISGLEKFPNLELKKEFKQADLLANIIPDVEKQLSQLAPIPKPSLSVNELHKLYTAEHHGRIIYDAIKLSAVNPTINALQLEKTYSGFDISKIIAAILALEYNTSYEEVHCVGLNRDMNKLHASVQVKQKAGYLGNLCSAGSKEYVAFYMDFGSGWEYMGTSFAKVHDISTLPANGLWYDVSLNVNLDAHRKGGCQAGKAKVRAILSWNTAPTPNDPTYHAHWGDREECEVEIRPLPKGITPGEIKPFMEKVGGMVVTDINSATGLATTTMGSASLGGAYESPFYGEVQIVGRIFNAPPGTKYRFKVTTPISAEHPLLDNQSIQTDTLGVISAPITLHPDGDGWLDYLATNPNVAIVADLMGRYYPSQEGMYTIKIEMIDAANNITVGNSANFFVDLKAPVVAINITSGGGDCADFTTGDAITGTYSISDAHAASFYISVTPDNGAKVGVDGHIPVNPTDSLSYPGGGLPATGKTGTFSINTAGVPRCGYNVWIHGADRSIVNSSYVGLYNSAVQGFCLRDK
jgi:hypothetical protein